MGPGLVKTSEDFGTQGDRPSHPELLDWLAAEFVDAGWSMKHIHQSDRDLRHVPATFSTRGRNWMRGSGERSARPAVAPAPAGGVDPRCGLAASGLLDLRIGGRSVRPPQPDGVAELGYANSVKWNDERGSGPLPPGPVHPLPAHHAVSAAGEFRRARSEM